MATATDDKDKDFDHLFNAISNLEEHGEIPKINMPKKKNKPFVPPVQGYAIDSGSPIVDLMKYSDKIRVVAEIPVNDPKSDIVTMKVRKVDNKTWLVINTITKRKSKTVKLEIPNDYSQDSFKVHGSGWKINNGVLEIVLVKSSLIKQKA